MANPRKKDETYQPRSVIWREPNYEVHLGQVLGVLDYDNNFDNTFQKWKLMIQFIDDVMEAIKQDIIPLGSKKRLDLIPNSKAMMKMDKIWHGQTYLGVIKSHDETQTLVRDLFYELPDNFYKLKDESGKVIDTFTREIIPMPRLKNMVPVGEIDSDNWGIQIRESMPLRYAWETANYATIVNDGKFMHQLSDGSIPKFEQQDMKSLVIRTSILHREVYNGIMDILPKWFNKNYYIFAGNVQLIMKWMKEQDTSLIQDLEVELKQEKKTSDRKMNL